MRIDRPVWRGQHFEISLRSGREWHLVVFTDEKVCLLRVTGTLREVLDTLAVNLEAR